MCVLPSLRYLLNRALHCTLCCSLHRSPSTGLKPTPTLTIAVDVWQVDHDTRTYVNAFDLNGKELPLSPYTVTQVGSHAHADRDLFVAGIGRLRCSMRKGWAQRPKHRGNPYPDPTEATNNPNANPARSPALSNPIAPHCHAGAPGRGGRPPRSPGAAAAGHPSIHGRATGLSRAAAPHAAGQRGGSGGAVAAVDAFPRALHVV